ncbi:Pex1p [Saccharomyces cerevisiae x Saccharomyces kudriavzevii VIN7]|uniref:Peroxisomal ATPase PEX1 n=1 Tax=Saccharomyces cerevisiae x Saccharomyces kudriavzevii (strain VIN7) TaxID=1095631 RepID=H0GX99_SACCK|nr:Pex1p [Saccharomyces cerevisiae x Saccharomyces kudriavzevii VIN7]
MTATNSLKFENLRIQFSNAVVGNFLRLPHSIINVLESTNYTIQEFGIAVHSHNSDTPIVHLGWDGHDSGSNENTILINPVLATVYNMNQKSPLADLYIQRYDHTRLATEVYITPETSDDWEIIDANSMRFQNGEILHQTRIVTPGETLICYLEGIVTKFKVERLVPSLSSARITDGTLVVVAPKLNKTRSAKTHNNNTNSKSDTSQLLKKEVLRSTICKNDTPERNLFVAYVNDGIELPSQKGYVSIIQCNLRQTKKNGSTDSKVVGIPPKMIGVCIKRDKQVPKNHIALSSYLWEAFFTHPINGARIKLQFLQTGQTNMTSERNVKVNIKYFGETLPSKDNDQYINLLQGSVLTDNLILPKEQIIVELRKADSVQNFLDLNDIPKSSIQWKITQMGKEEVKKVIEGSLPKARHTEETGKFTHTSKDDDHFITVNDIKQEMMDYLTSPIVSSPAIILDGKQGMGKTRLLKEFVDEIKREHHVFVKYTDCDTLQDTSNLDKMQKLIMEWVSFCYWYGPSLIVLDNVESLFGKPQSNETDPSNGGQWDNSSKILNFFINQVTKIFSKNNKCVRVLFSGKEKTQINSLLFDKHFVSESWSLRAPDKEARAKLLEYFFSKNQVMKLNRDMQFSDLSLETEGFSPLDLKVFTEKVFYDLQLQQDCDNVVTKNIFLKSLSGFTPSALRGVKLTKETNVKWGDIGALTGAKKILLETLEWPTRYEPIFANCPLRLRSGILLYGYPGCGKTLLASAVAQQCGLNFISVKGPEVLNKFIGASEQNIRELFERAQSVKPCILFFDEFDSIAPKRGHDSTGVTDRVVNQLLTQMDGAEGLDGVYILAATSRPDMIDSALLRPGRLDKSVICNIPTEPERLDILESVVNSKDKDTGLKKIALEENTDLTLIAQKTVGFSGADLQGLCYNAYLKSVHRWLSTAGEAVEVSADIGIEYFTINEKVRKEGNKLRLNTLLQQDVRVHETAANTPSGVKKTAVVTINDLIEACHETKPSISMSELVKLREVYDKFQEDRNGEMPNGENSIDIGSRLSLM